MLSTLFSPWPSYTQEEADVVSEVLLSNKVNYWTGTQGRKFEKEFANFSKTDHAIALANGTLALDLSLYGLQIGSHNGGSENDEVIVTSRSFIASVSAIINAGARPVFADVDNESQNITPETVAPHITKNTRAILCVHLAGWPCDMNGFRDLIGSDSIKLIEDCAQAHGAKYNGRPVGGLGDVAAWSFCQDKIMTTGGEGGMVTCNDEDLWKRMWAFKDHGKDWDTVYNKQHSSGFRWLHETIGTNWRLTEMQSAIGRIQLKKMEQWHKARVQNAVELTNMLAPLVEKGLIRIPDPNKCVAQNQANETIYEHAYYKFYAFIRPENLPKGMSRDDVIDHFNAQGLACFQGSCSEIYLEKAFDKTGFRPKESLPMAKELGETSLMFLVHPGVTKMIETSQICVEKFGNS